MILKGEQDMEENATKEMQEEIEGMVKNLREIVQEAQTARITKKNWKTWRLIQILMWKMRSKDKEKSQLLPSYR